MRGNTLLCFGLLLAATITNTFTILHCDDRGRAKSEVADGQPTPPSPRTDPEASAGNKRFLFKSLKFLLNYTTRNKPFTPRGAWTMWYLLRLRTSTLAPSADLPYIPSVRSSLAFDVHQDKSKESRRKLSVRLRRSTLLNLVNVSEAVNSTHHPPVALCSETQASMLLRDTSFLRWNVWWLLQLYEANLPPAEAVVFERTLSDLEACGLPSDLATFRATFSLYKALMYFLLAQEPNMGPQPRGIWLAIIGVLEDSGGSEVMEEEQVENPGELEVSPEKRNDTVTNVQTSDRQLDYQAKNDKFCNPKSYVAVVQNMIVLGTADVRVVTSIILRHLHRHLGLVLETLNNC
uniref:uncharacterized protein n=1 Tax=Myxine glutinosa TaxID=7769 RepID=UPI00358FC574